MRLEDRFERAAAASLSLKASAYLLRVLYRESPLAEVLFETDDDSETLSGKSCSTTGSAGMELIDPLDE